MEIYANDKDLRAALGDQDAAKRRFGAAMAKKLQLRLEALTAAESLADFWPPKSGPERCHELKGNRNGLFSVDVKQPYRLLFKPIEAAPPDDRADEQQRWRSITAIELLAIEDTHG
jgi:plasmid maintenance system killer protein